MVVLHCTPTIYFNHFVKTMSSKLTVLLATQRWDGYSCGQVMHYTFKHCEKINPLSEERNVYILHIIYSEYVTPKQSYQQYSLHMRGWLLSKAKVLLQIRNNAEGNVGQVSIIGRSFCRTRVTDGRCCYSHTGATSVDVAKCFRGYFYAGNLEAGQSFG